MEIAAHNILPPTSQQLQAYVAWVNSQLKKKVGLNPVQDLRQDLRDGVVLAHLLEIVAGENVSGIHHQPNCVQERRDNVEKVLQFVASKKIRMHQTSAKDIVDGNLKSIMRLILTLAAHFKPVSGRFTNQNVVGGTGKKQSASLDNHRPHSTAAMAQGAAAALADVRQDVSQSGRDIFLYRQRNSSVEEIGNPYWSVRAMVKQYEGNSSSETSSLASPSPVHSAKSEVIETVCDEKELAVIQSEESITRREDTPSVCHTDLQCTSPAIYPESSWEDCLLEQQDHLEREMEEAKKMISGLQALLLNGSLPEDEQRNLFTLREDGACPEEQLVIIKSRLDQSMSENQSLKSELLNYKQENRNLQGIKDALQQRLATQESSVLQLKQELLRANMDRDELQRQNVSCVLGILQYATDLQKELDHRKALPQQYMNEEDDQVSDYMSHPAQTNGFIQSAGKGPSLEPAQQRSAKDLQLVRDALRSLRNSFSGHDPQHHTIDSLEQGISSLMDRLHAIETQRRQDRKSRGKMQGSKEINEYRDSWPPNTSKLGEVTLRDFRAAIGREGSHRYHFKALDPEFGTVKEEVFHDEDIIPGWEGKIVAWVEEDHGSI
ncbi:hypothetical protein XELAEV_18000301mg [Xenopus laevis]|uniref:Dixin n=1 Tax=Xenopus laevis TaxID=8355 RepID=A0A974GZE9_XENLA|nr:hypothetical protein XELAEV_18000301mg [Xenopus laevis]